MNAEKLNEAWECNKCNQLYSSYDNAIGCCTPNHVSNAYKCSCGDIYEQEEVAEECCKNIDL
ncbi:MAG: hypothetical protein AABY22_29720 [Nanoarchaeota archaeon]